MNAPLRVPTSTRTPLNRCSFQSCCIDSSASASPAHWPRFCHASLTLSMTGLSALFGEKELVAVDVVEPGRLLAPRHLLHRLLELDVAVAQRGVGGVDVRRDE